MEQLLKVSMAAVGVTILSVATSVPAREAGEQTEAVSKQETPTVASNELGLRGKQLRAEIDSAYKKLTETGALKNQGMGRNFITDVVSKYIPIGISFDDAETILRAAGFTIRPRTPNPRISDVYPEKYDVIATIDQYVPTQFGKTSVSVSLRPKHVGDYSVVQTLNAEITRIFL